MRSLDEVRKVYCLFFNVLFKQNDFLQIIKKIIQFFYKSAYNSYGAVAQLARAPALQAGGQEFDSPQLHHANEGQQNFAKYKREVQGNQLKKFEAVLLYGENF